MPEDTQERYSVLEEINELRLAVLEQNREIDEVAQEWVEQRRPGWRHIKVVLERDEARSRAAKNLQAADENARVADLTMEEGKRQIAALKGQLADSYVAHLEAYMKDDAPDHLPALLSRATEAEKRLERVVERVVKVLRWLESGETWRWPDVVPTARGALLQALSKEEKDE